MNRYYIVGILLVGGLSMLTLSSKSIRNSIQPTAQNNSQSNITDQLSNSTLQNTLSSYAKSTSAENAASAWATEIADRLRALLKQSKFEAAVEVIDDAYTQASVAELEQFKQLIANYASMLAQADQVTAALILLAAYCEKYDDADIWTQFAHLAEQSKNWSLALSAYSRVAGLEHRPDAMDSAISGLVRVASNIRAELERRGDQIGILAHYQSLHKTHPNNSRFMFEVAQSYLRLDDYQSAREYLELLQYDVEFSTLAQQKLTELNGLDESARKLRELQEQQLSSDADAELASGDIVVPLLPSGNSYVIDVVVNSRNIRMLLDTGASITAISNKVIRDLKPADMNQKIQLQTANGTIDAKLFRVKNFSLGPLRFSNVVVAEIDLPPSNQVQGLLGTDVLNQLKSRYGYVIDNQRNALIFRPQ